MFHLELLQIFSKEKSVSNSEVKPPGKPPGGGNFIAAVIGICLLAGCLIQANYQTLKVKVQSPPVTLDVEVDKRVDRF
jgi:hypothetical protein